MKRTTAARRGWPRANRQRPGCPSPNRSGTLAADRQDGVEGSTLELYRRRPGVPCRPKAGIGNFPVGRYPSARSGHSWRSITATSWCSPIWGPPRRRSPRTIAVALSSTSGCRPAPWTEVSAELNGLPDATLSPSWLTPADAAVSADAFGPAEPGPGAGTDVDQDRRLFPHHRVQGIHEGRDFGRQKVRRDALARLQPDLQGRAARGRRRWPRWPRRDPAVPPGHASVPVQPLRRRSARLRQRRRDRTRPPARRSGLCLAGRSRQPSVRSGPAGRRP